MKAMQLTGIREMEMRDVPEPTVTRDTDVLIRLNAVGVCGSDVHYYETGRIGSQVVQYPYTVGHECAGTVERVGAAVTKVKPGDRIAIDPAVSCWECDQCKAGRPHTCRNLLFLGCPGQLEGCLSEYMVMPENSCYLIREGMTFDEAAASEPLAIGVYAVKQSIQMPGATIGILGTGPIGLSVLLAAKAKGVAKALVTDKLDERLDVAKRCGADWTGNPDHSDIVSGMSEQEPSLLDCVFDCCGEQDAIDQALELLKPGGKLMIIGIPRVDRISFLMDYMRRKEICIQNVRRQNECVQDTLDYIDEKIIDVNQMITHHFDFADTKAAFDMVAGYRDGVVKAMITFQAT